MTNVIDTSGVAGATDQLNGAYDVVVIGGGAAGLSGALMLARARRSVVVIDAGAPRNAPAEGVHGLLGLDGTSPADLLERGRADVHKYGGHVIDGNVVAARRIGGADADPTAGTSLFEVELADGRTVRARRLLATTGLVDELPDLPGLRERWGRDVVHCPYCHGWEIRDQAIGVVFTGPLSMHQVLLFRQWTADLTLFCHTSAPPTGEVAEQLHARGIRIVEGEIKAVRIDDETDRITGVELSDGALVKRDALAVATRMVARADYLSALGLKPVEHTSGAGEYIPTDAAGRTDVDGV
ncbi:MAG: NAD(P)/FAD-dependent oxidoreductase, partial [Actinocrinis sp.]